MLKTHKVLRAAKNQCRVVVGKRSDGKNMLCLDTWRVVVTDDREVFRYGTMTCLAGHVCSGVQARLLNPMERRRI